MQYVIMKSRFQQVQWCWSVKR